MMLKKSLKSLRFESDQTRLIKSIEGAGDILVFETSKKRKNRSVIQGMKRIEGIVDKLFVLKEKDPDRFEQLLLDKEFRDLHEKNREEAALRLAFEPEEQLILFSTFLNQILRVHESALDVGNDEISRNATYRLAGILASLSQHQGISLFIEQILRALMQIARLAISKQDISMFPAAIHWYVDIVFNKIIPEPSRFNLEYLELYNKYLLSSVKYIIQTDSKKLFESFISSQVDGIHIDDNYKSSIWNYAHLLLSSDFDKYKELNASVDIEDKVKEINRMLFDIFGITNNLQMRPVPGSVLILFQQI